MIPGRSNGVGTFLKGELTIFGDEYRLDGTRSDGVRFGARLTEVIYEGYNISPGSHTQINRLDLAGHDFRLSNTRLDIRRSSEYHHQGVD